MLKIKRFLSVSIFLIILVSAVCASDDKVVIIGFDGADANLVEKWMAEGHLPNLKKLSEQGSYARLTPTNPPQTPISWSTFATGRDPGETEIFDFLKRVPGTYFPTFAMMEEGKEEFLFGESNPEILGAVCGVSVFLILFVIIFIILKLFRATVLKSFLISLMVSAVAGGITYIPASILVDKMIPVEKPSVSNNRKGNSMWGHISRSFQNSTVFRVPNTFPPEKIDGCQQVSGLGVPDLRGRIGTPSYYTTDPDFIADDNKYSIEITKLPEFEGVMETSIHGPFNKIFSKDKGYPEKLNIPLKLKRTGGNVEIETSGTKATLVPGQWSDWIELEFPFNFIVKVRGIARFYLIESEPYIKLSMSPVHFHPAGPPLPISNPVSFSEDLFDEFGYYKTMGWAIDTWSLDQELFDEKAFLEDCYFTADKYEEMLSGFLDKKQDRLLVHVFMFTDRVQHMFWRFMNEEHPAYNPELAAVYGDTILESYKRMDRIAGMAMDKIDDNTALFIMSDHGFASWERSVNYNTWLVQNGLMHIYGQQGEKDLEDLFDKTGEFFSSVDWSKTKAYAMGLGNIYINLKGREPKGIVEPGEEYEAVKAEIIEKLESFVDEETGIRPVNKVYRREDIYRNFNPDLIPDLRAGNTPPYRVSWQTSLGGMPSKIIETNTKKWSGDHCSYDPVFVKGIIFSNRIINEKEPDMIDIHPTVLKILGMEMEPGLAGKPLVD